MQLILDVFSPPLFYGQTLFDWTLQKKGKTLAHSVFSLSGSGTPFKYTIHSH